MIKGLHYVWRQREGKPGKWYVYAYRGGPLVMTSNAIKKPTLTNEALEKLMASRNSIPAGTIAALIHEICKSSEYKSLASSSRKNWDRIILQIEIKWGKSPLSIWSDPRMIVKVISWRDEVAHMPRTADYRITVLQWMLKWARLRGYVKVNVADGIPNLYKGGDRSEIVWTTEDRTKFAAVANQPVIDALELACMTGLRLADLAALTWDEVGQHAIVRMALKSSKGKRRRATVPLTPDAHHLLKNLRNRPRLNGVNTVLTTGMGKAWSAPGLGKSVGEARDRADIRHTDGRKKHLHDCRVTFATILISAGFTDEETARVLAWEPATVSNIRAVYVDDARVVVHMAERIAAASVKHDVKQRIAI